MAVKKRGFAFFLVIVLLVALAAAWLVFGNNVNNSAQQQYLYIPTGATYIDVKNLLHKEAFLVSDWSFDALAKVAKYPDHIRPGKYRIGHGMSNYKLIRILRNGSQTPVKLVINKLRTKQDLVHFVATQLEADSIALRYILADSTYLFAYGLDTNTAMCLVIPDTYEFFWNTNAKQFFDKIGRNFNTFWTDKRKQAAAAKSLTITQSTIIASIVEEETNATSDKPLIASVYINRLIKGIPLQADPTIKFALGDFTIRRVTGAYLHVMSPYNTYLHTALPPGPICTPSKKTVDAVLQSPQTDYLYFCAKPELNGYSNFATNLADHMKNAKAYQQALDARGIH